jgi:REP element-mobilizing transposase RayT
MSRYKRIHVRGSAVSVVVHFHHSIGCLTDAQKLAFERLAMHCTLGLGCVLLDFAVMGTHAHLVFFIPLPDDDISDEDLLHAAEVLNGKGSKAFRTFRRRMENLAMREGVRAKAIARRGNLSELMRAINQRFAEQLNKIFDVKGPAIEGRFHSAPVSPKALVPIVVYNTLNPARAGLESIPGQSPFTLYSFAKRDHPEALAGIHWLMQGEDEAHSLRILELRLAEAGQRLIPGKRALTAEEAQVLIDGRNDCGRTHPIDFEARADEAVCPPPTRPRNAHTPLDGTNASQPTFGDYIERGIFIGDRDFVLSSAQAEYGSADPDRVVAIDADADLYCYSRPDPERLAREHARQALSDARERADMEAEARTREAETRKQARRDKARNAPRPGARRDVPSKLRGPVTGLHVFLWLRAQQASASGKPHDPREMPPALSLFIPYTWRDGDCPPSDNPLLARANPLDLPLQHYLPKAA